MTGDTFVDVATSHFRSGANHAYLALREAVTDQGLDPGSVAVVDFNPESAAMSDGAPFVLHHVVVVTDDDRAFDGWLTIDPAGQRFDPWNEIPSRLISDVGELARRSNDNRRTKQDWNVGLPPWVTHPGDFLYNRQIQSGRRYLGIVAGPC